MASGSKLELAMRIKADLDQARNEVRGLGGDVETLGDKSEKASSEMGQMGAAIGKAAGALVAAAASGAFASWIKGSIDAAAQLQGLANVAGTTTTQFQEWAVGARTVGVSNEQLSDILKDVNDKVGDFLQTGAGPMADFFNGIAPQIGVTADEFRSLSGADALQLYVSSLEKANLSQGEMTFYMEAIASDATKLLPLLTGGGAGMAAWADQAQRMGLILSNETIVQAKEFNQQLDTIGLVINNVGSQVAAEMLPTLNEMAGLLIDLSQNSELASAAADVFGIVLKGLAIAAIGVGSTLASVGRSIGGLAAAATAAATGEFAQAGEILRQLVADNEAGAAEAEARINRLINGGYQQAGENAARANRQITDSQREATLSAKEYQEQQEAANKASENAASAAKKQAEDAARALQQLTDQQENYVLGLERQASLIGLNTSQVREAEIAEKALTGALLERAQAAAALITAEEKRLEMVADAKTVAELQIQLLRAQGKESEAVALELEQRYGDLVERLSGYEGGDVGVGVIDKLINIEQARAQLSELQSSIDQVFDSTGRQEQSIQTQLDAGLITEGEARRRIVELHKQQATEVENLLPLMEELAIATGDPAALERVERIRAEIENTKDSTNELAIAFRDGLQGGLEESIMGLVDGTMSLRDALESLVLGIADSMARMASEQLADMATQGVMNLFTQGAGKEMQAIEQLTTKQVMSIQTVTNAQKTGDIARATSSVAAANTTATGQAGAAAQTTSAWAPAATTASIGSFGAAAAIGISAVLAALAMAQSFNGGGQIRGAGTNTSDSIPAWLSDEEFITRAAVVKQPGMLPLLKDVNERGWEALHDWAGTVYHSTGGLAGVPAPAAPSPVFDSGRMSEESALTANVANNFRFAALFDIEDVANQLGSSPGFTDVLIRMTANNATAMQSALST